MTAEELLSPRFEVIAEYPLCRYKKGSVLVKANAAKGEVFADRKEALIGGLFLSTIEKYPHLFRKMNWWEGREEKDMPKKLMSMADDKKITYNIVKWDMKTLDGYIDVENRKVCSLLTWNPEFGYIPVD